MRCLFEGSAAEVQRGSGSVGTVFLTRCHGVVPLWGFVMFSGHRACPKVPSDAVGRTRLSRPTNSRVAAGGALVLAMVVGGCSTSSGASPTAQTTPAATSTKTVSPNEEPTGTATRPPDPLAKSLPTLKRSGSTAATKVPAAVEPFDKAVSYPDGVKLKIVSIKQAKTSGKGPGVFVGSPLTQIDVELTNTSSAEVKLDQVVVAMLYGSPQKLASAVYEDGAVDLSGVVAKGQSAKARYMFSVPTNQLTSVTLTVDFDGKHAAATFKGSVK